MTEPVDSLCFSLWQHLTNVVILNEQGATYLCPAVQSPTSYTAVCTVLYELVACNWCQSTCSGPDYRPALSILETATEMWSNPVSICSVPLSDLRLHMLHPYCNRLGDLST